MTQCWAKCEMPGLEQLLNQRVGERVPPKPVHPPKIQTAEKRSLGPPPSNIAGQTEAKRQKAARLAAQGVARERLLAWLGVIGDRSPTLQEVTKLLSLAHEAFEPKTCAARLAEMLGRAARDDIQTPSLER